MGPIDFQSIYKKNYKKKTMEVYKDHTLFGYRHLNIFFYVQQKK